MRWCRPMADCPYCLKQLEGLREIADARDGQNVLQARIDRALELLEEHRMQCCLHLEDVAAIRAALTGEGE